METFTDQDLIAELQKYDPPVEMRTGGFTQQDWADAQNISISVACDRLSKKVKAGILINKRQRCEDGIVRLVYYKP